MNIELIKIRSRGQLTLPLPVRKALEIEEGDYLFWEVENNRLILSKMPLYKQASFNDGIWRLIGSAQDKEGKNDVSVDKHKYLGEKT